MSLVNETRTPAALPDERARASTRTGRELRSPRLSAVIVTHQGAELIGECIASVIAHAGPDVEILVVDNASTDGTPELVRSRFPSARLFELEENTGYGAACNLGVQEARGRLCLVLNQDLVIESPLAPALERLERDAGLGVLGCRMHYAGGRLQPTMGFEHTPGRILLSWWIHPRLGRLGRACARNEHDSRRYARRCDDVDWISGAFLLVRRTTWTAVGGMDTDLFMYVEDVDFCRRVRSAGLRAAYDPCVEAQHLEGSGRTWIGERALRWTVSSYGTYTRKHYGLARYLLVRAALGPVLFARGLALIAHGCATLSGVRCDQGRSFLRVGVAVLLRGL